MANMRINGVEADFASGETVLEVARRIRRDHADQEIIIVAITGYGQREDRLRSEAAGINLHLVKPVEADELQQLLATSAPPFR